MQLLPWIVALAAFGLLAAVLGAWALRHAPRRRRSLPGEWALAARPVFSSRERRVYRLLREALPHHIMLAKLPLVRFCQPTDPTTVAYWFDLLGNGHVTFAICSPNGRVLAAVDLDGERAASRRVMRIKQAVLGVCRVRYLRCSAEQLPSIAELQLLVPTAPALGPGAGDSLAPSVPPANLSQARASLTDTVATRRAQRTALWHDSAIFQDSFFAGDPQSVAASEAAASVLPAREPRPARAGGPAVDERA